MAQPQRVRQRQVVASRTKVLTLTHVPLGPSGFDPRLSPTLEVMDHDGATKLATVTGPCC